MPPLLVIVAAVTGLLPSTPYVVVAVAPLPAGYVPLSSIKAFFTVGDDSGIVTV